MNKRLTTIALSALLATAGLAALPVESASATGGWRLTATRVMNGQTIYKYTNSSGGVMYTDHPVDSNGSAWVTPKLGSSIPRP